MGAQHPCRLDHGHTLRIECIDQIGDEAGTLADHGLIERLIEAYSHRLDLAHRDASIGQESFKKGHQCLQFPVDVEIVGADAATTG